MRTRPDRKAPLAVSVDVAAKRRRATPVNRTAGPAQNVQPEDRLPPGLAGHDFSQVRIHPEAAEVDDLRAAVTRVSGIDVGRVPLGIDGGLRARGATHEARVTLGSEVSRHDIAHELAHAAQQISMEGPWLGASAIERRADDVASAVLSGELHQVYPGRAPPAAVLHLGEPYSREAITLPAPPAGLTIQAFKDQLDDKLRAGDISAYSVSGIKRGDPEEKYLYNALVRLADKQRWGSELDLITSIGAAKGEVTVRFDAAGKAEATLVGKSTPTVPVTFPTVAAARTGLKAKYKLADVRGENRRSWTLDELNKVDAAWSRLSLGEAAALEGFTLIRTNTLTLRSESLQGETSHTDELDPGSTTPRHVREIRFADSAFAADDKSFIGDAKDAAPASFEILIHEVGHALESKPYDDAKAPAVVQAAKANQAAKDANALQHAANVAINAPLKGKYAKKDSAEAQPMVDAVLAAQTALKTLEASPDATSEAAAKSALADRDAALSKVSAANTVLVAFKAALAAQDAYFASEGKLLAALAASSAATARAEALKSGPITTRLQGFVDFVTKEGISPPTEYAARHWPGEPAEFFDEAFSLWKNDPVFFARYSPKLKAWFEAGSHLK